MSINPLRVKNVTSAPYQKGAVVYRMCRDIRAHDNEALLYALEYARTHNAPLIVEYVIWNYVWTGATRRFYDWVLPSLKEVESTLRAHNIPLVITLESKKLFREATSAKAPDEYGAVIFDTLPLHFMKKWKEKMTRDNPSLPIIEIDAHNCIPVEVLSQKQEFAAHTIRRKVHEMLPKFLESFSALTSYKENEEILQRYPSINFDTLKESIVCDETVSGLGDFVPGEAAAKKVLQHFLSSKLDEYDEKRNAINEDGQSNLSPYIAHGNISRRYIVLELLKKTDIAIELAFDPVQNGSNGKLGSIAAFIEECVVRAELCENFCFYNSSYDAYEGFPAWAKESLAIASSDTREYVYTYEAFKNVKTHDDVWNAAQLQMVHTGKMHGYMRMYWAKKILEWTQSPEEAMQIAVKLNDVYELDGRDPNGYAGCAWSIGGVHDRPWFKRPIFGAIRYMAVSGVEKRGKIKTFMNEYLKKGDTLFE